MLLLQKAYAEGGYALCLAAASLHDKAAAGDAAAAALLELQTEIVKSWPSEWGLEANKLAIQVLGGAGYVSDYPVEQLYRDNRLNMIHEGTAGIHAKTLLGRKVQRGRAAPLFAAMRQTADEAATLSAAAADAAARECLRECAASLARAVDVAEEVTALLTAADVDRDVALTNAHDYLTMLGHACIGWVWLRSAVAASRGLDRLRLTGGGEAPSAGAEADEHSFYHGKLHTCRFFHRHELPKGTALAKLLGAKDTTVSEMQPQWF